MEMQYIIYMQEACGPPHIDHYRSKLCSVATDIHVRPLSSAHTTINPIQR